MQSRYKLINTNEDWNSKRHYKIGQTASYFGVVYTNATGNNSIPGTDINWISVDLPFASPTESGKVKTTTIEVDPIVYTATKVDELINQSIGAQLAYFFYEVASDIGGYYKMLLNPSTGVGQDITSGSLSAGTYTIANFITEPNNPSKTYIPKGYFRSSIHAKRTGTGAAKVFFEIYKRNLGGTETLLSSSTLSSDLTTTIDEYLLSYYLPTQIPLLSSDRLVYRFKTTVTANTPQIGIHIEDNFFAGVEIPSYIVSVIGLNAYTGTFIYTSGPQTFTVPANTKLNLVLLNRYPIDDLTEWTLSGTTLTILTTLVANDEIKAIGIN
jgi:hypothetical protein